MIITAVMPFRRSNFRRLLLAGFALGWHLAAQAQLVSKSPFLPAAAAGAPAPISNAPLEFLGYLELGQGPQYRLFDPAKKTSIWVGLNERNPDFEVLVKQFDRDNDTLTVEHRGAVHSLAIRKAKVVSGGPIAQALPPPVPAQANVMPAVTQSVVVNPTPADEARRLDAVASEIARRRALRTQAEQTVSQPPAATPPPAPVPVPPTMQPR